MNAREEQRNARVTDDPIPFPSAGSHRLGAGARFSRSSLLTASGLMFTPHVGAAGEQEFDAKARATAYGYGIDTRRISS